MDQVTARSILALHPDIIQTGILARLDGPTLASVACASSELHTLSSSDTLWREICNAAWPSTAEPRVRHVINSFPSGHRSFYSDSFPALRISGPLKIMPPPVPVSELISAVDFRYQDQIIMSRVHHMDTKTACFMSSPFWVNLLDPNETIKTQIQLETGHDMSDLSLSWILIDPARSRAANILSLKPVSMTRKWISRDLEVRFATILEGEGNQVQCAAVVTCGSNDGLVKNVCLVMEDMKGRNLSGEESLVILQNAMENGERRRGNREGERERYERFVERRRETRSTKRRKEKMMEMLLVLSLMIVLIAWVYVCTVIWPSTRIHYHHSSCWFLPFR